MSIKESYQRMYNKLTLDMIEMSADKYSEDSPYINLRVAIIIEAIKSHDIDYFMSDDLDETCYWLRLPVRTVQNFANNAWAVEASGKRWEQTPQLPDEM